jgi:hypothetical protein
VSPVYEIEGQWHGLSKFVKQVPKWWQGSGDKFLDQTEEKLDEITVQDISKQGPLESRRVWKDVADGIRSGDFEAASSAKSKLEVSLIIVHSVFFSRPLSNFLVLLLFKNEQRAKRKEELANGTPWQMSHFDRVDSDEECDLEDLGITRYSYIY